MASTVATINTTSTSCAKPKQILSNWCTKNNLDPIFKFFGKCLFYRKLLPNNFYAGSYGDAGINFMGERAFSQNTSYRYLTITCNDVHFYYK